MIAQISAAGAKSLREIARALDARGVQHGSWREVDSDASQRSRAPSRFEVAVSLPPAVVSALIESGIGLKRQSGALGQCTKSLRSSPLRGGKSREALNQSRARR